MTDHTHGGLRTGLVSEFADVLLTQRTVDQLLELVVRTARRTVAGADGVSVSLARDGKLTTSNYSDEVVRELDEVQYRNGDGPCVDAVRRGRTVSIGLDRGARSYQRFNEAARQRFMTAVLSVPLVAGDDRIGALNVYSASIESFTSSQREAATVFAHQASVLLANGVAYAASAQQNESLRDALATREMIGMAKGIIMAREHCSPHEAFERLRTTSQHANRKLRTVAEELVASVAGQRTSEATARRLTVDG